VVKVKLSLFLTRLNTILLLILLTAPTIQTPILMAFILLLLPEWHHRFQL